MESSQPLFAEDLSAEAKSIAEEADRPKGLPRVLLPNRSQMEFMPVIWNRYCPKATEHASSGATSSGRA